MKMRIGRLNNKHIATTISTGHQLVECGVEPSTADMKWHVEDREWKLSPLYRMYSCDSEEHKEGRSHPAWSWDALFSMLPTVITINGVNCRLQVVRNGTEIVEHRYMPSAGTPDEQQIKSHKIVSHTSPVESAAAMVMWLHNRRKGEDTDNEE